jgi:hypothetical protein
MVALEKKEIWPVCVISTLPAGLKAKDINAIAKVRINIVFFIWDISLF